MAVTIFKLPTALVGTSSTVSKVNAVHQPIEFIFQRRDFEIDSVSSASGNVRITTTQEFTLDDIPVGSQIKLASNVPAYNGVWNVLTSTPPFEFTLYLSYDSPATGYINCLARKNWKVETFLEKRNIDGTLTVTGNDSRRQDPADKIPVNVAPYLKPYVISDDQFLYDVQNYPDKFESGSYLLSYTESYVGSSLPFVKLPGEYIYVNSIMQPRYRYGSNLAFYLFGNEDNLLNWLTMFVRPTYFHGFPFCLNFLYVTTYRGVINQNQVFRDINGVDIEESDTGLADGQGFLNRTMIQVPSTSGSFSSQWSESFSGIYTGTAFLSRSIDVKLTATTEGSTFDVSETITVDFDSGCHDNPVYLNWLGTDGSRNFWLFEKQQTVNIETEVQGIFEPYVEDLATQRGDVFDIERTSGNSLTIGCYVPIAKIQGIKTMLFSINVLMLVNPDTWQTEGPVWESVRPVPGSFVLYNTDEVMTELVCTIELMATNIQSR